MRCHLCDTADEMEFAATVQCFGAVAAVCPRCVEATDDVRACTQCHELAFNTLAMDCCSEVLCEACREDHADAHEDPFVLRGLSRRDFL